MALNYAAPPDSKSAIDRGGNANQMNTFFWLKKSLVEARKEIYFMNLASTTNMPKHYGKTIKVYEYIPLLDDRNINDQGIDANGATLVHGWTAWNAAGERISTGHDSQDDALAVPGAVRATMEGGNLYGSSKDIGTIEGKLPLLTENGGRVNRVGFTRISREGSIHKFGFFYEFTQEALDFDSDDQLKDHLARELMNGAVQLTEAVLQKDLLSAATTVIYSGAAMSDEEITGEEGPNGEPRSVMDYRTLMRLDQVLTDNRTPKQTRIITGSRLVDTRVIPAARVAFVGSELVPLLKEMRDLFGNKAFIEVQHYADAGNVLNGEIGSIDAFRIIQVPEMLHWAAAGAEVTNNEGFRTARDDTGVERYNIYPFFVVGDDAFTTIGFQTDGKSLKFNIITKMPGRETATAEHDPYGEKGFSSIKWYYGILVKRPERLGLIKTVAPL